MDRARTHLSAFVREWAAIFVDNEPSTVCSKDKDHGWFNATFVLPEVMCERIKKNVLPLELGEFAYQLRAALDGLMWDTISITQGAEPTPDAKRVTGIDFPILDGKSKKFEDCAFLLFPFPDKLRIWLESIQPDAAEKPEGHPDRGLSTALGDIHDLARFDRHRRLRVVAAMPTSLRFGVETPEVLSKLVAWEWMDCDLLGGQHQFLRFQLETIDGTPVKKLKLKTEIGFEILLEDIEPFEGINTGTQLGMLADAVEYVIGRFEEEVA